MNISKRLKVIAGLVPDNSFILDVGCDHALLSIYVVLNKKNVKAIASDINEGPLKTAQSNVKKYNLEKDIIIIQSDGLNAYQDGVDTVILAGLGSTTIVNILESKKEILSNIDRLIISSNNDYYYLRKSIAKLGYKIVNEKIVCDKKKYYPIIVFEKGEEKYNDFELKYGPILLKEKDEVFVDYLSLNKNKLIKIYSSLSSKYLFRKIKLKKEISLINKYM